MAKISGGNNAGRSKGRGKSANQGSASGKTGFNPGTSGGSKWGATKKPKSTDRLGMGKGKGTPPNNKQ